MATNNICNNRKAFSLDANPGENKNKLDQGIKEILTRDRFINTWADGVMNSISYLNNRLISVPVSEKIAKDNLYSKIAVNPYQPESKHENFTSIGFAVEARSEEIMSIKKFRALTKTLYIYNQEEIMSSLTCEINNNEFIIGDVLAAGGADPKKINFNMEDISFFVLTVKNSFNSEFFIKGLLRGYYLKNQIEDMKVKPQKYDSLESFILDNLFTIKELLYSYLDISISLELKNHMNPVILSSLCPQKQKVASSMFNDCDNGFNNIVSLIKGLIKNSVVYGNTVGSEFYTNEFGMLNNVIQSFSEESLEKALGKAIKWFLRQASNLEKLYKDSIEE